MPNTDKEQPYGILPLDKPAGITSHDAVAVARRVLKTRRIGHAGTLDPFADGLLILLVGRATRLFDTFMNYDKTYRAVMRLGERTATGDNEGPVLERHDVSGVDPARIREVFAACRGDLMQVPPMYSALKFNGRKLYEYAREGVAVDVPARPVTVYENTVNRIDLPEIEFMVRCSKGTYIRKLAEDLGGALGSSGHLTALRRTAIGPYAVEKAFTWDELKRGVCSPLEPLTDTERS